VVLATNSTEANIRVDCLTELPVGEQDKKLLINLSQLFFYKN